MSHKLGVNVFCSVFLVLASNCLFCQVYNLYPLSYYDFEANPSALTSVELHKRYQLIGSSTFTNSNPMFTSNFRYSKLLPSLFGGFGVSLSHTEIADDSYTTLAICGGYRTVLFDKLYLRFGAAYKFHYANSFEGAFDYYSFQKTSLSRNQSIFDNVNFSVALTSGFEQYYLSYSFLNVSLPWKLTDKDVFFPTYHLITAGNFMRLFIHEPGPELSYVGLLEKPHGCDKLRYSQYLNLKLKMDVSRKWSMRYGGSVGIVDSKYFQIIPLVGCYTNKIAVNLSFNIHFRNYEVHPDYKPSGQLNLIYLIWKKNHRSRF